MIVRTCVLSACMIVVPGLALCSHHLPAGVRSALWQPLASHVKGWLGGEAGAAGSAPVPAGDAWRESPAAVGSDLGVRSTEATARERLAALGAVAIECRRLESDTGVHVASCRVPLDAGGQLHRLFQAPGATPAEATEALVGELEAWRTRLTARAADRRSPPGGS